MNKLCIPSLVFFLLAAPVHSWNPGFQYETPPIGTEKTPTSRFYTDIASVKQNTPAELFVFNDVWTNRIWTDSMGNRNYEIGWGNSILALYSALNKGREADMVWCSRYWAQLYSDILPTDADGIKYHPTQNSGYIIVLFRNYPQNTWTGFSIHSFPFQTVDGKTVYLSNLDPNIRYRPLSWSVRYPTADWLYEPPGGGSANSLDVRFAYNLTGYEATCPQGNYAAQTVLGIKLENSGEMRVAMEQPNCLPCEVGTWNTCRKNRTSCWFHVLKTGESVTLWNTLINHVYKEDIAVLDETYQETLTGRCYPCKYAIFSTFHYGIPVSGALGYDVNSPSLPFFCPGGSSAPVNCPADSEGFPDARGYITTCTCKRGMYNDPSGLRMVCKICPAGYSCMNGMMTMCPPGTYSFAGASACTPCNTDVCVSQDGLTNGLRAFCDAGSMADARCVSCRLCRNLGSRDRDSVFCLGTLNISLFSN